MWLGPTPGPVGSPLTTKGDVYGFTTVDARLAVGTDGQVVVADSAEGTGLKWVAREPTSALVATSETTASTSYTDLATAGPAVTVTTGTVALVIVSASLANDTAGRFAFMGYAVTGASSLGAGDAIALSYESSAADDELQASWVSLRTDLTAGSNTFTAKYRAATSGTATFKNRHITVLPY